MGFAAASLGVTSYWFGPGPSVVGNKANIYNQTYSSLTAFGRDVNDTSKTLAGYVLVATGAETPAAGIPAQLATYEGAWLLLLESGGPVNTVIAARDGTFTAEADFANKSLEYNVLIGGSSAGSGSAAITGNRFLGEFTTSMSDFDERKFTGGGTIAGAFYGPDAEEMAGVLAGSASTAGGESAVVSGGFFGQKK